MKLKEALRMLEILKARDFVSRQQLAEELQTTPRNILELKNSLEDAGFHIESVRGKFGGYRLVRARLFPVLSLKPKELHALKESVSYIQSHEDFFLQHEYIKAMDKVLSAQVPDETFSGIYMKHQGKVHHDEKKMMEIMEWAKKDGRCVKMEYRSLHSNTYEIRMIHPYEIIYYRNAYYCLAYSLHHHEYRCFKFSEERMRNVEVTQYPFQRDRNFSVKDHVGSLGLMKGDLYELDFLVYGKQARWIKEQQIGLNPKMEWFNDTTLRVQTVMEGKKAVMSFLLGLGKSCKVNAPIKIQEELKQELNAMLKQYEKQ